MNRILDELPAIGVGDYSNNPPMWFRYFFKCLFAMTGIGLAMATILNWHEMQTGFRFLIFVLVPLLLFFAFHPRLGLTDPPSVLANSLGMYFNPSGSLHFGGIPRKVWLFVPWKNISNIRVSRIVKGEFSEGMAMDVKASSDEVAEFFGHYGIPADSKQFNDGRISVVFYESSSKKMLAKLLNLMEGGDTTHKLSGMPNDTA